MYTHLTEKEGMEHNSYVLSYVNFFKNSAWNKKMITVETM